MLSLSLLSLTGCWTSKIYERDVGRPEVEVEQMLLPGPRRVDATVSRSGSTLELELSRGHRCRRIERTTVRRERVEETSLGAGTYVTGGIVGGLGLLTAVSADDPEPGVVLLGLSGLIFALAATGTGTEAKPLPPERSSEPGDLEPCAGEPIGNARVLVASAGLSHEGESDEAGRLVLQDVAPGPLRVLVDGQAAIVHERSTKTARRPKPESPPPAPAAPPSASPPASASLPAPSASPPVASAPPPVAPAPAPVKPPPAKLPPAKLPPPRDPSAPLPPPPPPPPGARVPAG